MAGTALIVGKLQGPCLFFADFDLWRDSLLEGGLVTCQSTTCKVQASFSAE